MHPRIPQPSAHACTWCGRPFLAANRTAATCSHAHQQQAWRTYVVLLGTHGYVGGKFTRLAP